MSSRWYFAVVFAILVPLAGCGAAVDTPTPVNPNVEVVTVESGTTPTSTESQTPTPIKTTTEAPTEKQSVSSDTKAKTKPNRSQLLSTDAEGCRRINETIFCGPAEQNSEEIKLAATHAFENLPENQSERLALTADLANASCVNATKTANLSVINPVANAASLSKRQLYRVKHGAETLQQFNNRVDPETVESAIQSVDSVAKYATVIGTFQKYNEAACAFDRNDPESVEDYYLATVALTIELTMVQYGVSYRVASKTTRMASHTRTFRMIQSHLGDDALRIAMSETHWLVRGQVDGVQAMVVTTADEYNLSLSNKSVNETRMLVLINSTTGLGSESQRTLNELKNATAEAENKTQAAVNNATSNETYSKAENVTGETTTKLKQAWNESGSGRKIDCLSKMGGEEAEKFVSKVLTGGNPLEQILQLPKNRKQDLSECLSSN